MTEEPFESEEWSNLGEMLLALLEGISSTLFDDHEGVLPWPERMFGSDEAEVLSEETAQLAKDYRDVVHSWITAFSLNHLHHSEIPFWTEVGNELFAFAHGFGWVAFLVGAAYGEGRHPLINKHSEEFKQEVLDYYSNILVRLVHNDECGHTHGDVEEIDNPFTDKEDK